MRTRVCYIVILLRIEATAKNSFCIIHISYAHSAEVRRNSTRNVWLVVSCETVAKRNFRFSKHTVYDDIKSARAQPVHKVKADRDESGEPARNVRLKGSSGSCGCCESNGRYR